MSSTMGAALARAGYQPPAPPARSPPAFTTDAPINVAALSHTKLEAQIARLGLEVQDIQDQLGIDRDEGRPRGSRWRSMATKALTHKQRFLAAARLELKRRNRERTDATLPEVRAARTEQARQFLSAAVELLSKEEVARIWARARENYGGPLPTEVGHG